MVPTRIFPEDVPVEAESFAIGKESAEGEPETVSFSFLQATNRNAENKMIKYFMCLWFYYFSYPLALSRSVIINKERITKLSSSSSISISLSSWNLLPKNEGIFLSLK